MSESSQNSTAWVTLIVNQCLEKSVRNYLNFMQNKCAITIL